MAITALLDANVIYAAPLRDLLIRLALADLFRARWSADIHSEWMRTLAATRPDIPADRIERLRRLIDEHVRDAVVDGYAALIPSLTLPDPNDRHVLAAAIVGRADVIVTCNVTDFPAAALAPYGIDVQHPDQFLSYSWRWLARELSPSFASSAPVWCGHHCRRRNTSTLCGASSYPHSSSASRRTSPVSRRASNVITGARHR